MATWLLAFFRYSTAPRAPLLQTDSSTLYRTTHVAVKFKSSESADLFVEGVLGACCSWLTAFVPPHEAFAGRDAGSICCCSCKKADYPGRRRTLGFVGIGGEAQVGL